MDPKHLNKLVAAAVIGLILGGLVLLDFASQSSKQVDLNNSSEYSCQIPL